MMGRVTTILCVLLGLAQIASAQPSTSLRVQAQVKPAFRITPMVHRFEAPRGKLLEFEFEIESMDRPTSVRILPVALRQQENGVIMPDEKAPLGNAIRLLSPSAVELDSSEKSKIQGQLRVPRSNSQFHSFGILVKDLGRPVNSRASREQDKSRVGINFVTQYLLRCDVSVIGVRGDDVRRLQILSGELVEVEGQPQARVWISNPTDSFLEFEVRCRITVPESRARRRSFSLVLPVRANLPEPDRYVARILPGSRVRLAEFVPEAVLPGAYDLEVELLAQRRRRLEARFPLAVRDDDFPAQRAAVLPLASQISLHPAHVELSLRRRGRRYSALTFVNNSPDEVEVHLDAQANDESAGQWLSVRPATLTLSSHSSRKVLVSIGTARDLPANRYGEIDVRVRLAGGDEKTQTLPVAVLARVQDAPKLSISTLQWDTSGTRPALVAPIANLGDVHLPLDAKLTLFYSRRQTIELFAGFGRWLLPGQNDTLRFHLSDPLPPGTYRYHAEIGIGEGRDPLTVEDVIHVQAEGQPTTADATSQRTLAR